MVQASLHPAKLVELGHRLLRCFCLQHHGGRGNGAQAWFGRLGPRPVARLATCSCQAASGLCAMHGDDATLCNVALHTNCTICGCGESRATGLSNVILRTARAPAFRMSYIEVQGYGVRSMACDFGQGVHTCRCTRRSLCLCIYTYIHMYIYILYIPTYIYTHTYIQAYVIHTYIHTCVHTCLKYIYVNRPV